MRVKTANRSGQRKRSLARCCMRSHAANCVCGRYCFYTGHAVLAAVRYDLPLRGRLCTTTNVFTPPPPDSATSCLNVVSSYRFASGSRTVRVNTSGIHCDFELVVDEDLDGFFTNQHTCLPHKVRTSGCILRRNISSGLPYTFDSCNMAADFLRNVAASAFIPSRAITKITNVTQRGRKS